MRARLCALVSNDRSIRPASRFSAQQISFDAKRRPFHRLCPPFHRSSPDLLKDPASSRARAFSPGHAGGDSRKALYDARQSLGALTMRTKVLVR